MTAKEADVEAGGIAASTTTEQLPKLVEYPDVKIKLSELSMIATCPYCKEHMKTNVETRVGPFTLLSAVFLAHCLLCWVPFFIDRFLDVDHACSKCQTKIGRFKRM